MRSLVLVGGGGHASDVLQAIEALNAERPSIEVLGLLDDGDVDPARFTERGVEHLGPLDRLSELDADHVLCAGWPWTRRALLDRLGGDGRASAPVVHPSVDVGAGVRLGDGSVVLSGAHLSPMVQLGAHGLVSYNATVGHDTVFGDLASVMPGANVSGDVVAGHDVLVGTGAVVLEGLRIGDRARIGAGAVVTRDVDADTTVVGVPARPVSR